GLLRERATRLGVLAGALAARAASATDAEAEAINRTLISVARALVHLDYSVVDRFEQDAAIATGPYPSLAAIRRFGELDPDSDAFKFLTVGMSRARNRVAFGLR